MNNNTTVSSDLIRGHIDTIILRSLYFGDRYGYDIIKEIEQKTDGEYKLKQPTLYSCLKRLEDQGFTSSYWGAKSMGGRKKYYTLTDMGRQLFIKNQTDWRASRQIIEKLIEGEEFENDIARQRGNKTFADDFDADKTQDLANEPTDELYPDSDLLNSCPSGQTETDNSSLEDTSCPPDETRLDKTVCDENPKQFDNIAQNDSESVEEQRYDNFEMLYENDPDSFKQQERYDNFSADYVPPAADPYEPSIFVREETEEDIAARTAYEKATASFNQTKFTKSFYELDQHGDFIKEFGIETDANELESSTISEIYFDQKDKPSYIDDVSGAPYNPILTQQQQDTDFTCDDELPYAEHLLKEYSDTNLGDTTELPCESTHAKSLESPNDKNEELSDTNELPCDAIDQKDEALCDDSIELPQSEPLVKKNTDDLTKNFLKYDNSSAVEIDDEEIIKRQYHTALSKLIREQKPRYSPDPFVQKKLENTAAVAAQTGDEMLVRNYSDTVKKYNTENYYYSNRLRLFHHGIMFAIMLIETVLTFAVCELFLHKSIITMTELWIYIGGVLISLALPVTAFVAARQNLNKRKKADHDLKSLTIFRIFLCALLILIVFLINSYFGILTNKFSDYLASFIYPVILLSNVIISGLVFGKLYKSKKFQ